MHRWPLILLPLLLATACAPKQRSTRLQLTDLDQTVLHMSASLLASDWLADRDRSSPPLLVTINKVENLSTDIVPPNEQWMLMARVVGGLEASTLRRERNVRFQLPPERQASLREAGFSAEMPPVAEPTHLMSATILSATRTVDAKKEQVIERRQEYYLIEFRLEEVRTRELKWTNRFEFKREAEGLLID